MMEFQEFERDIAGINHTFRLNREEAKRRGLKWVEKPETKKAETKSAAPTNKSAKPADK